MEPASILAAEWRATLCIRSDHAAAEFDALLVHGGTRGGETQLVAGETPFDLAVPDGEVTVVVRPRDPTRPVVAEFTCEEGGRPVARGRGIAAVPVLYFRRGGVLCGGLPSTDGGDASAGCLTNRCS